MEAKAVTSPYAKQIARIAPPGSRIVETAVSQDVLDEYVQKNWKKREVGKCQFPEDFAYPCEDCTAGADAAKCPYIGAVPVVWRIEPSAGPIIVMHDNVTRQSCLLEEQRREKLKKKQKKQKRLKAKQEMEEEMEKRKQERELKKQKQKE